MTNHSAEITPPDRPAHASRTVIVTTILTMAVVIVIAWFSLRVVHRIRQYRDFVSVAEAGYRELEVKYSFEPPAPGSAPSTDRLAAFLVARDALLESPPAELAEAADDFLSSGWSPQERDLPRLVGRSLEFLHQAVLRHQEALRNHEMNLHEYEWLHGYVINALLHSDANSEARAELRRVMEKLEQREAGVSDSVFDAEAFRRSLAERYSAWPAPPPEVLQNFSSPSTLTTLVDVLGARSEFADLLGIESETVADKSETARATDLPGSAESA